jgi:hypothetical protein
LLNPLPVYGLAVATLALDIALLLKTRAVRETALALVILSAASAWLVYYYGEAGYDRVKTMVDETGDKSLEEHMRRGEQLIYIFYVLAALSAAAIIAEFAVAKAAVPIAITTLILAAANLCVGAYNRASGPSYSTQRVPVRPRLNHDKSRIIAAFFWSCCCSHGAVSPCRHANTVGAPSSEATTHL